VALALRTGRRRLTGNPFLTIAVAADAALVFAALYWAPLQALLGTEPLAASDLALVGAVSLAGAAAVAVEHAAAAVRRRRSRPSSAEQPLESAGRTR